MALVVEKISGVDAPASALTILERLRDAGHTAYICGGAVRDFLMGRQPRDWDIATDAVPERVAAILDGAAGIIPIGRAFGVLLAVMDGRNHEIAAFRSESGYADGRRPGLVRFSDPASDAQRRDFTVNALFYDPQASEILDYVGGLADLRDRRLRAVGVPAERFREDHLRLLRAVRFAARTGFDIDPATWQATVELAPLAARTSAERQAAELEAMLLGGSARRSFELMADSGLLAVILPEADRLRGVEQPPEFHPEGDVWVHTLAMLGLFDAAMNGDWARSVACAPAAVPENPDAGMTPSTLSAGERAAQARALYAGFGDDARRALAWAVLLHDLGKPDTLTREDRIRFSNHDRLGAAMADALLERLRRPRALRETASDLIARHMHFASLRKMRAAKLRRWLSEPTFGLHWELHRLDCESSHGMLSNWAFGGEAWRAEQARPPPPKPLVGGRDLLDMGVRPGPEVGHWLRAAEDARLEGLFSTREEALQWLRRARRLAAAP